MTTKKVQKRGARGNPGATPEPDPLNPYRETADALAELLSDPALPETLRNALVSEVRAFAGRHGGFTHPGVLPVAYPALCAAAGHDPLAATVAAMRRPRGGKPLPVGVPVELKRVAREDERLDYYCDTWALRGFGVRLGDTLRAETEYRKATPLTGDVVVLKYKGQFHAGVLQVRGDKVLLLSTRAGDAVRRFNRDKVLFAGRVSYVLKHLPRGNQPEASR